MCILVGFRTWKGDSDVRGTWPTDAHPGVERKIPKLNIFQTISKKKKVEPTDGEPL